MLKVKKIQFNGCSAYSVKFEMGGHTFMIHDGRDEDPYWSFHECLPGGREFPTICSQIANDFVCDLVYNTWKPGMTYKEYSPIFESELVKSFSHRKIDIKPEKKVLFLIEKLS